jgi:hypothetical protein
MRMNRAFGKEENTHTRNMLQKTRSTTKPSAGRPSRSTRHNYPPPPYGLLLAVTPNVLSRILSVSLRLSPLILISQPPSDCNPPGEGEAEYSDGGVSAPRSETRGRIRTRCKSPCLREGGGITVNGCCTVLEHSHGLISSVLQVAGGGKEREARGREGS